MPIGNYDLATLPAFRSWHFVTKAEAIDGDTIKADVHMGLGIVLQRQPIRLRGINAPEISPHTQPGANQAKLALQGVCNHGFLRIRLHDSGRDKYGRLLADLFCARPGRPAIYINAEMIKLGLAVETPKRG